MDTIRPYTQIYTKKCLSPNFNDIFSQGSFSQQNPNKKNGGKHKPAADKAKSYFYSSSGKVNSVKPASTKILNQEIAFLISETCTRSLS